MKGVNVKPSDVFKRQHMATVEIDGLWGRYRSDMWDREVTAYLADLHPEEYLSDLYCSNVCWCRAGE